MPDNQSKDLSHARGRCRVYDGSTLSRNGAVIDMNILDIRRRTRVELSGTNLRLTEPLDITFLFATLLNPQCQLRQHVPRIPSTVPRRCPQRIKVDGAVSMLVLCFVFLYQVKLKYTRQIGCVADAVLWKLAVDEDILSARIEALMPIIHLEPPIFLKHDEPVTGRVVPLYVRATHRPRSRLIIHVGVIVHGGIVFPPIGDVIAVGVDRKGNGVSCPLFARTIGDGGGEFTVSRVVLTLELYLETCRFLIRAFCSDPARVTRFAARPRCFYPGGPLQGVRLLIAEGEKAGGKELEIGGGGAVPRVHSCASPIGDILEFKGDDGTAQGIARIAEARCQR